MISAYGDFETRQVSDEGLIDKYGNPIPGKPCMTLNNNWGYYETDKDWKSPELIIHTLVNCGVKTRNLLLNVGPDARGRIPDASIRILKK